MTSSSAKVWNWEWPSVGPTPVHRGLDSEMFDRTDFPYTDTLVREAIQNSLDARLDQKEPVIISFQFHSGNVGPRRVFFQQVMEYRRKAKLEVPDEWSNDKARWLVVEDFNTKGLSGPLKSRTSDFWGYWLNFGISNKTGRGRGAHGIGRVTFLIASRVQSVIGYTRRNEDTVVAACGMAVLPDGEIEDSYKSTHAYLAQGVSGDIYNLHESQEFHSQLQSAFSFSGYDGDYRSGLGLAILYPYDDLKPDGILAAAIENFAPAIIGDDLVIKVGQTSLDSSTIFNIAQDVESRFRDSAVKKDVNSFLKFVRGISSSKKTSFKISLSSTSRKELQQLRISNPDLIENIRTKIYAFPTDLEIEFPINYDGKTSFVNLRSIVGACPLGRKPIDLFFRRGMCLPDVKDRGARDLDIVSHVSGETSLTMYLNFCEGKAHLDLLESKETLQKLKNAGFGDSYHIKRLVKHLSEDLRGLFQPDLSEPNFQIFEKYFVKPKKEKKGTESNGAHQIKIDGKSSREFEVTQINDNGVRIKARAEFEDWPVNATITLAYANGSNRPSWSPHDFMLENQMVTPTPMGCVCKISNNTISALECGKDTNICIYGFDSNREVVVSILAVGVDHA